MTGCTLAQAPSAVPAPPAPAAEVVTAVDAVLAAFARYRVVAFGETHGSAAQHAFLRDLLADPRLVDVVDVVAVEFGTARHQALIDHYIAGETVDAQELRRVWSETTQRSGVWDHPVYEEFFATVRELNADRPPSQRLRVLLGDPPIDWSAITAGVDCNDHDPSCLDHWLFRRDEHFAGVVQGALDAGDRVLIVAGAGHVLRHPARDAGLSISDRLDAQEPGTTWVIAQPTSGLPQEVREIVADRDEPVAVLLDGGSLSALEAGTVFGGGTVTCDPGPCPSEAPERLGSVADALFVP